MMHSPCSSGAVGADANTHAAAAAAAADTPADAAAIPDTTPHSSATCLHPKAAAAGGAASATSGHQGSQAPTTRKRLYFIDWLRVVLTVLVVVNHVWNSYRPKGGDMYWFAQKADKDDWVVVTIVDWLVSTPSMPYAMCLFFLLAGYFTPGSYNRKGPLRHVYDRLIRLLIPVVVYAVLINPLILTVNKAAGIAPENPSPFAVVRDLSYAGTWRFWFSHFHIAFGPTWFVWCLFWFDIAYVLLRLLHSAAQHVWARLASGSRAEDLAAAGKAAAVTTTAGKAAAVTTAAEKPGQHSQQEHVLVDFGGAASNRTSTVCVAPAATAAGGSSGGGGAAAAVPVAAAGPQEYAVRVVLCGMGLLTLAFTLVSFVAVMATYGSKQVSRYDEFWLLHPLLVLRPTWFGPNAISFALGCKAVQHDILRRLPARVMLWCLAAAAMWWPVGNLLPTYVDAPYHPRHVWGKQPVLPATVGYVLYVQFAAWSFAVVWGLGALLLFREVFNEAPGRIGQQVVAGAYGAYITHPLLIPLWAWAFMWLPCWTLAGNAIAVSPLVVLSAWGVTAAVRCIPGTRRVLG